CVCVCVFGIRLHACAHVHVMAAQQPPTSFGSGFYAFVLRFNTLTSTGGSSNPFFLFLLTLFCLFDFFYPFCSFSSSSTSPLFLPISPSFSPFLLSSKLSPLHCSPAYSSLLFLLFLPRPLLTAQSFVFCAH